MSQMFALLLEEGLDAREALPDEDRVVLTVPRTPGVLRSAMFIHDDVRERLAAVAAREQRSLDTAAAALIFEAFEARKRKSARKSA